MLSKFFKKKKDKQITVGDVVAIKRNYSADYPFVSKSTLLTVQKVQNDTALVIFMNKSGTDITRENIPVAALTKVG